MFLRVYELNELIKWKSDEIADTVNTLYDPTCKTLWHSACASGDSEYVAALASTAHEVTIFERSTEAIVATLCQSKKEIPLGLEWHPAKPAVASVCNGNIFIWKQRPRPCWAAYAPDFTELGENLVYREKESEFDVEDEDFPKDDGLGKNQAEEFLDVESVTAPPGLCSSDEEDPNKIGGSVFIVNASPAVIPLKTTLPSQLRLKDGILAFIPELKEPNHVEQHEHKKHKKKKRKKSEEPYHHQNGTHKNEPLSPSPERDTPTLNYNYNQRPPSRIDSSQTTSRKSSDAFVESPPRAMRHRLKRKRPSKASKSSTSTSPEKRQSYSRSPSSSLTYRNSPVYAPLSSPPNESPPLPIQPLRRHSPSPINISVSSSNVTPTHENINEQPTSSAPPFTLTQMPPLLTPPPVPKQMAEEHPGLTNISSDEEKEAEEPPTKRQKRSSSSSSSSSAVNHAWDSD
uniref:Uncharacterized protein n=1 Tax=Panagrolaimus davidi TaxID=227884 RepID=A0A914Q886_9BILA